MTAQVRMSPPTTVLGWSEAVAGWWLSCACLVLLGYALMGKGAGYIGVPPLFIGELLLLSGLGVVAVSIAYRDAPLPGLLWWVGMLGAWGLLRTVPFLGTYGVDALRDAVIWGYAAFAFIVYYLVASSPERIVGLLRRYGQFARIFVVGMPAVWLARYGLGDAVPRWPWADVAVLEPKPGDAMVHLAGVLAFWASCPMPGPGWFLLGMLGIWAAIIGAYERAAMFAFLGVFLLCAWFRPQHRVLLRLLAGGAAALVILAVTQVKFEVPVADSAKVREISFAQFAENALSAVGNSEMGDLDDTKEWRLNWWREIIQYTLRGEYFWTGKGFGVNLADDDGFQVMADHSLRSPHNAHLVMLARAGVPGLALWAAIQLGWAWAVFRGLMRCLADEDYRWGGVMLFLLGYWSAFMCNASFDVFLEGPMGGVWFWSLYGLGLAALKIREDRPQVLYEHANPYCP